MRLPGEECKGPEAAWVLGRVLEHPAAGAEWI